VERQVAKRIGAIDQDAARIQGAFFAAFDDRSATLDALRRLDPVFEDRLRHRADRILAGRFDLLGHADLAVGNPVDWHLEPIAGVRAPVSHWSTIPFLDPSVAGDHKLIWELSRHRALVTLGQAWWCTRETAYGDACERLLTQWLDANPSKMGIHWASSLEVSFRSIAWVWLLALAGDVLSITLRRRLLGVLAVAARHIERYLSTWFSPNTHVTGEALGLFVIGCALPQLDGAERWQAKGADLLLHWMGKHVRPDGSYVEQSSWYQRYTTDFCIHFLILAERGSVPGRVAVAAPLVRLLEHLAWITRPDGTMPLIGDDDGGRLLFLDDCPANDTRATLAVGAALFRRGDFAAVAGSPSAELVWLLGPAGLKAFEECRRQFPGTTSHAFPDGGLHVIRSDWGPTASLLTIDAGPHGFLNGGHAHADALSIDLTVDGRPVFVDPGTFTYTQSAYWRDRFRETASHNAVTVDGCGAAIPEGPFQWRSRVSSVAEAWYDDGTMALFAGRHDGFEFFHPAVRYRRSVAFVRPSLWLVRDEIECSGDHELAVHWQCAPLLEVELRDEVVTVSGDGRLLLSMQAVESHGKWSVTDDWVSPAYGVRRQAKHLTYVRRGADALCVTTVMCTEGPVGVVPLVDVSDAPGAVELRWGDRRGVFATRHSVMPEWLESDATVVFIERESDTSGVRVVAANVSRLAVSGNVVLQEASPVPGVAVTLTAPVRPDRSVVPSDGDGSS
jgi:hypothetical protein